MWWFTIGFILTLIALRSTHSSIFQCIYNFQSLQFSFNCFGFFLQSSLFSAFLINSGLIIGEDLVNRLFIHSIFLLYISKIVVFYFCSHLVCVQGLEQGFPWRNHLFIHNTLWFDEDILSWIIVANCQCSLLLAQVILMNFLLNHVAVVFHHHYLHHYLQLYLLCHEPQFTKLDYIRLVWKL